MPLPVEYIIVIEDSSGSKIQITKVDDYRIQLTFSGYSLLGGSRKINVKKVVWVNDFVTIRDRLLQTRESETLWPLIQDRQVFENIEFGNSWATFWIGIYEDQPYIGVYNTIGERLIVFNDIDRIVQELLETFIDVEEWFTMFFHLIRTPRAD